jgi:hypothetical protein
MRTSSSRRKLWAEVVRRGWLVVLTTVLVAALGWGVSKALTHSSEAEAVLVVHAAGPLADQPDASTKLAATYATLIPLDSKIQDAIEKVVPGDTSYTTSNDPNTAVLRLDFSAPDPGRAIEGAKVAVEAITGPDPVSDVIDPSSVQKVRLPTSATGTTSSGELAAVGAILGLVLGAILVAFWRGRDPRIDDLADLRGELTCPCYEVEARSARGTRPFFGALAHSGGRRTVLVPCGPRQVRAAELLRNIVNDAFGPDFVGVVGVPGSEEAGELEAAGADRAVLVCSPGIKTFAVTDAADLFKRQGATIDCAVLVSGRPLTKADPPAASERQAVS